MRIQAWLMAIAIVAGSAGDVWGLPLVSVDHPVYGPGSITRDPNTQLDWLDWSVTSQRNFNDVSSELGPTGEFAGFRYADFSDLAGLVNSAGGTVIRNDPSTGDFSARVPDSSLSLFLNDTVGTPFGAITAVSTIPGTHHFVQFAPDPRALLTTTNIGDGVPISRFVGHALVRSIIPEPATFTLGLLGIAGLGLRRRRRAA